MDVAKRLEGCLQTNLNQPKRLIPTMFEHQRNKIVQRIFTIWRNTRPRNFRTIQLRNHMDSNQLHANPVVVALNRRFSGDEHNGNQSTKRRSDIQCASGRTESSTKRQKTCSTDQNS